jgi:hypothetical protein
MKLRHDAAERIRLPPSPTRQPTEQGASCRHVMAAMSLPARFRIDLTSQRQRNLCPAEHGQRSPGYLMSAIV